jgi:hypothetical protein
MMGVAKFLVNKEATLKIDFDDPKESFLITGTFIRSEIVEGRKELVSLALLFNENLIPMGYKIRINDYLTQVRPENRGEAKAPETKAAVPPVTPAKQAAPAAPAAQLRGLDSPAPKAPPRKPEENAQGADNFDLQLPS